MLKINLNLFLATGDQAHIEADSLASVHEALAYFHSIGAIRANQEQFDKQLQGKGPSTSDETEGQTDAAETAPKASAQRKPRKAAAGDAAQPAESAKTEETPAAKSTTKYKPEDITAAVTNLANATSLATARGVLEKFGVKRAAEIKVEQYADFIKACEAAQSIQADNEGIL